MFITDGVIGEVKDAYLDIGVKGDLTSIGWFEANPADFEVSQDSDIIQVTHAALNFRDVMCATGRLSTDALPGTSIHNIAYILIDLIEFQLYYNSC